MAGNTEGKPKDKRSPAEPSSWCLSSQTITGTFLVEKDLWNPPIWKSVGIDFGENRVAPRAQQLHFSSFYFSCKLLGSSCTVNLRLNGRDVHHHSTTITVCFITDCEESSVNTQAIEGFSVCFKETAISYAMIFLTWFFSLLVQSVTHIASDPYEQWCIWIISRMCQDRTADIKKEVCM